VPQPKLESWNFTYFEDLFARDAKEPTLVLVAAKAFRRVYLSEPGEYTATLTYYDGSKTEASWFVRDIERKRRAKNAILFVGDGMTTNMITVSTAAVRSRRMGAQPEGLYQVSTTDFILTLTMNPRLRVSLGTRASTESIRARWQWTNSPSLAIR
jgi:alkaline phosphatase